MTAADAPAIPRESPDDDLADLCVRAVEVAAHDLGLDPRSFAEELSQGEVALLVGYLGEAALCVDDLDLRTRIDALLHRLTAWTSGEEA